jgi:serine protease Do
MKGIRYLQTTAPISGGSSGGGLFDCAGRLMGITTFYVDGQNLNFAIAADEFR